LFYFASGAVWTKLRSSFEWWAADIIFRVTGRGRIGADGLVCIGTLVGISYVRVVFNDRMGGGGVAFGFSDLHHM
jgi:mannose-binding lectin 1